jgi:hypothetical protein
MRISVGEAGLDLAGLEVPPAGHDGALAVRKDNHVPRIHLDRILTNNPGVTAAAGENVI